MLSVLASKLVRSLPALALSALLAPHAVAGGEVWIVDASGGPGFDFTDIQSAITVAQQNDRVFIRSGTYSGFVLNKPLIVRGESGVRVAGVAQIQNVGVNTRCTLSTFEVQAVAVVGCSGGVALEKLVSWSPTNENPPVLVQNSADVRMLACDFEPDSWPEGAGLSAAVVSASTLEVVKSSLRGQHGDGFDFSPAFSPGRGGAGLLAQSSSTISIALSDLTGGGGGWADFGKGQDGGAAFELGSSGRARVASSTLSGGDGGAGTFGGCGGTFGDGRGGAAIRCTTLGLARHSALVATGGFGFDCGQAAPFSAATGGQILLASTASPTLELLNANAAGAVTLRVRAPANSTARVWLGRTMITPTPSTDVVGLLTNRARIQNLGTVPAGGQVDAFFTLPSSVDTGELVIAQADVLTSTGELLYSNSVCFTRP
jgi:hypothetical protein